MGGKTDSSSKRPIFGAAVLLARAPKLGADQILEALREVVSLAGARVRMVEDAPKRGILAGLRGRKPETLFDIAGVRLSVVETAKPLCNASTLHSFVNPALWRKGAGRLADHRAHLLISEDDDNAGTGTDAMFDRATAVTLATAAVASIVETEAVIWIPARNAVPMGTFGREMERFIEGQAPLEFWLRWQVLPAPVQAETGPSLGAGLGAGLGGGFGEAPGPGSGLGAGLGEGLGAGSGRDVFGADPPGRGGAGNAGLGGSGLGGSGLGDPRLGAPGFGGPGLGDAGSGDAGLGRRLDGGGPRLAGEPLQPGVATIGLKGFIGSEIIAPPSHCDRDVMLDQILALASGVIDENKTLRDGMVQHDPATGQPMARLHRRQDGPYADGPYWELLPHPSLAPQPAPKAESQRRGADGAPSPRLRLISRGN